MRWNVGSRRWIVVALAMLVGVALAVGIVIGASRHSGGTRVEVAAATDTSGTVPATTSAGPSTAPETSTSASETTMGSTTAPAAGTPTSTSHAPVHVEHYQGTYQGLEHFALYTGRCPFLDHHLDSIFTLTVDTTWKFHADYCGTLSSDNKIWSGAGTFTFSLPDGATLTGTFADSAQIPSPGVPYTLNITGGTGRYSAASGSCPMDNHLHQIQFGVQQQYGDFTCDIRP